MNTFPQTATLGHAAMHYPPAKPLHKLHEINKSIRGRNTRRAGIALHTIACNDEEFRAVCEFLATRRIGGAAKPAGKRKALPRNKAK